MLRIKGEDGEGESEKGKELLVIISPFLKSRWKAHFKIHSNFFPSLTSTDYNFSFLSLYFFLHTYSLVNSGFIVLHLYFFLHYITLHYYISSSSLFSCPVPVGLRFYSHLDFFDLKVFPIPLTHSLTFLLLRLLLILKTFSYSFYFHSFPILGRFHFYTWTWTCVSGSVWVQNEWMDGCRESYN